MANFNSDIATQQASGRGDTRINGSLLTGQRRIFRATYTTAGTEAADDTITLGKLPYGAKVIGGRYWYEALGGTGTAIAKLGTSTTTDLLSATSVTISSAGTTAVTPKAGLAPDAFDGATDVIATLALSSGSVTAGKKVIVDIEYFV